MCTTSWPAAPVPSKGKRTRSNEPKAFEGLTQRPHCAACEHDAHHPQASPPRRPAPMPPTHRRPRVIDTSRHFCPYVDCEYRGWLGLSNLRRSEERRVGKEYRCGWAEDQAEDGIRDRTVTGVQTCALPISHATTPLCRV